MSVKTFKHSGELGDVIYALATVRALGGGILYLDAEGGEKEWIVKEPDKNRTRLKFNAEAIDSVRPLLLMQDYIKEVRYWKGETVDYNLDRFRLSISEQGNICDYHLRAFGLPSTHHETAWLRVDRPQPLDGYPCVVSRTPRYHGNDGFWEKLLAHHGHETAFVGFPKEHEIFEYTFGCKVYYHPTPTLLDLARVIAGCKVFACNTSVAHAIAEGLKVKDKVLEVYRVWPNVIFNRPGAQYV